MFTTHHLLYRGDYYEVTYDPTTGDITELLLMPGDGRRGEPLDYYSQHEQLKHEIQNVISRLNSSGVRAGDSEE
jgi:hypothetical protein